MASRVTKISKPTDNLVRRYTSLGALIHLLRTKELTLLSPSTWDDRNDAYYMREYARRKKLTAVLAACFARSSETYHHWRVFTHGSDGACIEFRLDKLRAEMKTFEHVRTGMVTYQTIPSIKRNPPTVAQLPFVKRYPFRDEKEFRIIYDSSNERFTQSFPIDLKACVSRIILSPWNTQALSDEIKATLKSIDGCTGIEIYRTSLIDNEDWKNAIV